MAISSFAIDHLNAVADAWIAAGADVVSFYWDDTLYRRWLKPGLKLDGIDLSHGELSVPVWAAEKCRGELRMSRDGRLASADAAEAAADLARLNADGALLTAIFSQLENNRRLGESLVDTRDQLVTLSSLTGVTQSVIGLDDLVKTMAAEAGKIIRADEVFFSIVGEAGELTEASYPRRLADFTGRIPTVEMVELQPDICQEQGRVVLRMPIVNCRTRTALLGVIKTEGHTFSSQEIKLARAIAEFAGAQIEKIYMIRANIEVARTEIEIELAQKIQQSLLLKDLPPVEGLDSCLFFQPASRIGGDYYDLIQRTGDLVDFIIGDISGKGMPAALMMAMTLKVIRSVAETPLSPTPDYVINRSNEILYSDYNNAVMFSSIFVGQYHTGTRELRYSNAGHSPVIYYRAGDKAEMLRPDTVPLGVFPQLDCQLGVVTLKPGDILVLATDGINETSNKASRLFGFTQLIHLVEKLADRSAAEIAEGILEAVQAYGAGKNQEDDRAMLVIKGV